MLKNIPGLVLLALAGILFLTRNLSANEEKHKVGILLYSEQASYQNAFKGLLEQMKFQGFGEEKVEFEIRNAQGKKDSVIEATKEFKAKGLDLIIVFGTPAIIVVAKEIKDTPVVFSMVFDPIGAGIVNFWESSGNNLTGSSTWISMVSLVNVLRKICPVKRLGVIYTGEEKQTVSQLRELQKLERRMKFTVVPANLTKVEDAGEVVNQLALPTVDSIFITGGTVVGDSLKQILEVAEIARIPTAAHLMERAEDGVLLAVAANSFSLGRLAGQKASEVLRGIKPEYIPIEYLEQYDIGINMKTARRIKMDMPDTFLKIATKVIE